MPEGLEVNDRAAGIHESIALLEKRRRFRGGKGFPPHGDARADEASENGGQTRPSSQIPIWHGTLPYS